LVIDACRNPMHGTDESTLAAANHAQSDAIGPFGVILSFDHGIVLS
jgi:hypothetical protein